MAPRAWFSERDIHSAYAMLFLAFRLIVLFSMLYYFRVDTYSKTETANIEPRQNALKTVFAHILVGNTYPYREEDWRRAINLAFSKGIDAFALNIGKDPWQPDRVSDAYNAALGTGFKLFFSFDMASLPCSAIEHGNSLRKLILRYQNHPNQLIYDNKTFVSTFGGELCRFGSQSLDEGWYNVLKSSLPPIHFVPAFFVDPAAFPNMNSIDGAFGWDSSWPLGNYDIDFKYDGNYLKYLRGKTYMAGVSPWFFTHYSPQTYNKNFIYRGDDWLFCSRWEILINERDAVDFLEVISWNDFGESHYLGPIDGAQPNSEAWTTGFDHQGWLDLMHYYIQAFKTGQYATITKDRIFLWGRLYPKDAEAQDPIGKPRNYNFTEDSVWAVYFLQADAYVELACGPSRIGINLRPGLHKVKIPLVEDCSVISSISRGGRAELEFSPLGFNFSREPPSYNFNAFVASSPV